MTKDTTSSGHGFNFICTIKNVGISIAITVLLIFIASCVAVFVSMPIAAVNLVISIITYFCVGLGAFITAKQSGANGLLTGIVTGLLYFIVLFISGCLIFSKVNFSTSLILSFVICVLSGAIGGIFGVNSKSKRRK